MLDSIVKAKLINSMQEFREAWFSLDQRGACGDNIFGTYEYLATCAEHLPGKRTRHIVKLTEDDQLICIAPLSFEREGFWTRIRSLGSGHTDYEVAVVSDNPSKASLSLLDYLKSLNGWDYLSLWDLPESDAFLAAIRHMDSPNVVIERGRTSPYMDLTNGFDMLWSQLPKSLRMDTERQLRRLAKLGEVSFQKLVDPQEIKKGLETLFDLHVRRWLDRGGHSQFERASKRQFFRRLASRLNDAGMLDFRVLCVGGKTAAIHYGFVYGKRFWYYLPTFDTEFYTYSVGRILLMKLIQAACDEGLSTFDFLVGQEEYKLNWPVILMQTFNVYIYNHTIGGSAARFWNHMVKPVVKSSDLLRAWAEKVQSYREQKK